MPLNYRSHTFRDIRDKQLTISQEAVEKFEQSKRELDEVVAQMESLVSPAFGGAAFALLV